MQNLNEKRSVLITGAGGFIGYHLAKNLARDGMSEIVLVDDFSRGKLDDDFKTLIGLPNVTHFSNDLTDKKVFDGFGSGYDEVYHLAAVIGVRNVLAKPEEVLRINSLATLNLLEWFCNGGGEKLVFASTSEVYALSQKIYGLPVPTPENVPLTLDDLDNPRTTYAASKIFGEICVKQYCGVNKLRYGILRYHNIYGPRMGNSHVIPEIFARAKSRVDPLVVYSANHTRAFCYVEDAVRATIQFMRNEKTDGYTMNVGNDMEEIAIIDLASLILNKAGISANIERQIDESDFIERRCPDISISRKLIGYKPRVMLDEGLENTLNWYKTI